MTEPPLSATVKDMALVLVVEDELDIARVLEGYLQRSGYRTERAKDGHAALTLFRASRPDLVLLDVMLPELDGIEVLKAIRAESTTPVIMLTARAEELDKLLGLELGADDYVTKPFRPREVMARVKAVLRRTNCTSRAGRRGSGQGRPLGGGPEARWRVRRRRGAAPHRHRVSAALSHGLRRGAHLQPR